MAILSTTLAAMRQGFMESLGLWRNGTTTSDGAAGGTNFPDATRLVGYAPDYFNTWWALITSGTYATQARRISDFVQSSGTVTVLSAFGGQIVNGVTFELVKYDPSLLITWALNKALQQLRGTLYKSILNEDLITGNALPNGGFQDWAAASVPDLMALVGAGASAAKETTIRRYGASSLKLTRAGADCYVHCSDTQWKPLLDLGGTDVDFEAWALYSTASHARLSIYVDGTSLATSSYHTGGGGWELLRIQNAAITAAPKTISARFEVNNTDAAAYFDHARIINPKVSDYVLPSEFVDGEIRDVAIQVSSSPMTGDERPCDDLGWPFPAQGWPFYKVRYHNDLGIWLLTLTTTPAAGYKMRLEGKNAVTKLSADTDTVPLSETQLNLLYPYAAYLLFKAIGDSAKAKEKLTEYEELDAKIIRIQPATAHFGDYTW